MSGPRLWAKRAAWYIFGERQSLFDVLYILVAGTCFAHDRWVAGLACVLVGSVLSREAQHWMRLPRMIADWRQYVLRIELGWRSARP